MLYLARDTVQLVKTWLEVGRVGEGRLLRSVRKDGSVGAKLDASQVPRIYKRMARRAGLPGDIVDTLSGAQHARRRGTGHDRLRHRVAGHPAVRALADDAHGPTLRGAVARAAQRGRAVGRAAEPLRRPCRRAALAVAAGTGSDAGVDMRPPSEAPLLRPGLDPAMLSSA